MSRLQRIFIVLTLVPWPGTVQAPAVVQYTPKTVVRAISPGFVSEVCIHDGQIVENGDKLFVLRNEQLEQQLADLKLAIKQSEIKRRMLRQKVELAASQAESKNREALQKRLHEKNDEVSNLTIHASADGKIIGRSLDSLLGTYVSRGTDLRRNR